ncbi:MAG: hypothetical protein HYT89_04075 [Candidatus Omnitrophica bacterium]|nr:hypothetical protein [Candidatus Omnitrophota bacterium]
MSPHFKFEINKGRKGGFLKTVSSFLICAFLFQEFAFANPDIFKITPQGGADAENSKAWAQKLLPAIPESIATIEDSYQSDSNKTVILIQDAHTNNSGQINVAKALDLIFKKDPIKYVFLEAGSGDESLSFLRKYASEEKRKQVAKSFLINGKLQGTEYLDLTSKHHFILWGVEDLSLYAKSVATYRAVAKEREKFQAYLAQIEATINALKPKIYNPFLSAFDEKYQKFEKGRLSLTDYFEILTNEAEKLGILSENYPHLKALKVLKEIESKIDFKKANDEEKAVVSSLPADDQKELVAAQAPSKISGTDKPSEKAFFALLEEKVGMNLSQYPELSKYFHYLKEARNIRPKAILEEQEALEEEVFRSLTHNEDEANLIQASKNLESLKKLFNLTLTPDEFAEYQKNKLSFDISRLTGFLNKKIMDLGAHYERAVFLESGYEDVVKRCEVFYSLTYERDQKFIQNLTQKMNSENQEKAVLITGGYHTPNLKYLLKAQGLSYICITPQVLQETNQKRYEELLLNQNIDAVKTVTASPMAASFKTTVHTNMLMRVLQMGQLGIPYDEALADGLATSADDSNRIVLAMKERENALGGPLAGVGGAGFVGGRPIKTTPAIAGARMAEIQVEWDQIVPVLKRVISQHKTETGKANFLLTGPVGETIILSEEDIPASLESSGITRKTSSTWSIVVDEALPFAFGSTPEEATARFERPNHYFHFQAKPFQPVATSEGIQAVLNELAEDYPDALVDVVKKYLSGQISFYHATKAILDLISTTFEERSEHQPKAKAVLASSWIAAKHGLGDYAQGAIANFLLSRFSLNELHEYVSNDGIIKEASDLFSQKGGRLAGLKTFFENELVPSFKRFEERLFELEGNVLAQQPSQDGSDTTLAVQLVNEDTLQFETRHWYGDEDVLGRDIYRMSFGPSEVTIERSDAYKWVESDRATINEPNSFRGFGRDKEGNIYLLVSEAFNRKYTEAKASPKNSFLTRSYMFYFNIVSEESVPDNLLDVHKVLGVRMAADLPSQIKQYIKDQFHHPQAISFNPSPNQAGPISAVANIPGSNYKVVGIRSYTHSYDTSDLSPIYHDNYLPSLAIWDSFVGKVESILEAPGRSTKAESRSPFIALEVKSDLLTAIDTDGKQVQWDITDLRKPKKTSGVRLATLVFDQSPSKRRVIGQDTTRGFTWSEFPLDNTPENVRDLQEILKRSGLDKVFPEQTPTVSLIGVMMKAEIPYAHALLFQSGDTYRVGFFSSLPEIDYKDYLNLKVSQRQLNQVDPKAIVWLGNHHYNPVLHPPLDKVAVILIWNLYGLRLAATPVLGPTRPDLEQVYLNQVEASTPQHVKDNQLFDIHEKGRIKVTIRKENLGDYDAVDNPKGLGLWKWLKDYEKEAAQATAGIRSPQNVLYSFDTRFRVNLVGVAFATLAKTLVAKENYSDAKLQKIAAGEVRYNTKDYVSEVARIQAAQGIKTYLPAKRETLTIWMTSFLTFMYDLAGGEFGTSSHANSSFFATKDLDSEGGQYLPEESIRFVKKIREMFETADKTGEYSFEIAAEDDPLIDDQFMVLIQNGVNDYTEYLRKGVATDVNLNRIRKVKNPIIIDNVSGAFHQTATPIFERLGIAGSFEWFRTNQDPFFSGIGKELKPNGQVYDWSQDTTIVQRDPKTGETTAIPVMERMGYDTLLKDKPIGTVILMADPDADRLVTAQIESADRAGYLKKLGIEYLILGKDRILAVYSPNQSFFLAIVYQAESLKAAGLWENHPRFIIMTTASSTAWREWSKKNGVEVINTPVGFKEIAAAQRKIEYQIAQNPDNDPKKPVVVTDAFKREVNLGVQPRMLFGGEESGGAVFGPEELIRSKHGRIAIGMREKSDGELTVIEAAMTAYLESRGMMLSDYLSQIFEQNDIKGRFDIREDIPYYNQSEPDPVVMAKAKDEGILKRTKNYTFYLSMALAYQDGKITKQNIIDILNGLFERDELGFSDLKEIYFVGDGVYFDFPDKVLEIRPSGTDAKSKAYGMGIDKNLLARYGAAVGNYSGELTPLHHQIVPSNYSDLEGAEKMAWDRYQEYYRIGLPPKNYTPPTQYADVEFAKAGSQLASKHHLSEVELPLSNEVLRSNPTTGFRLALQTVNPTTTEAWKKLQADFTRVQAQHLRDLFQSDPERAKRLSEAFKSNGAEVFVDYSKNLVDQETIQHLLELAQETGLADAIQQMFAGEKINQTENRAVLHTALRIPRDQKLVVNGQDVTADVHRVLDQMRAFSEAVNSGEWKGYTGKRITDIVNIGIGGSDLGPVMVTEALKPYATGNVKVHFVSNVDGTDVTEKVIKKLDPETTVEKFGIDTANMFEFWDWVGGRYSFWSAIGLSIAAYVGFDNFQELLAGAHDMDEHFKNVSFEHNIPVILALLSVWYTNFYRAETHAVLPYDQYLHRLPAYLQQAFMESNGKSVDRSGRPIDYVVSPIIFGEAGTNGQHPFYQLIHQGNQIIPADFIGVSNSHNPQGDHHEKLLANFFAQTKALAFGKSLDEVLAEGVHPAIAPHRVFKGNNPTNSILVNRMSPRALGALVAMYEHQIFAEGVVLNIFSFDQWGVELGKVQAGPILKELKGQPATVVHDASTANLLNRHRTQKSGGRSATQSYTLNSKNGITKIKVTVIKEYDQNSLDIKPATVKVSGVAKEIWNDQGQWRPIEFEESFTLDIPLNFSADRAAYQVLFSVHRDTFGHVLPQIDAYRKAVKQASFHPMDRLRWVNEDEAEVLAFFKNLATELKWPWGDNPAEKWKDTKIKPLTLEGLKRVARDLYTPAQYYKGLRLTVLEEMPEAYGAYVTPFLEEFIEKSAEGTRLATTKAPAHSEVSRARFFLSVGWNLPEGFQRELSLMKDDRNIQILSLKKDAQDILVVVNQDTREQLTYDVSIQALTKVREKERHDLSGATDITEQAFGLHEANGMLVSTRSTKPTAKVVLVDSFPDLPNDAFYRNLILRFSQTLAEGSQVVLVSREPGKAEKIAALARAIGVRNSAQFMAMSKGDLAKLDLPTSYLVADTYLDQAKALYGKNQRYFRLQSPDEKNLIGVYALTPVGVLMDLVSLEEDWERAAQVYSQIVGRRVNRDELKAALRGALLIPFVSKLIGRLVAQVYMAERAIGGSV